MNQKFAAILFDLDGVIADSEPMWNDIDSAMLQTYGIEYAGEHKHRILGTSFSVALNFYRETFNIRAEIEEMMLRRRDIARDFYAEKIPIFQSAPQVLATLKKQNYVIGLATSSIADLVLPFLKRHDLNRYFDAITTGEEVENGKPAPDIYLAAARKVDTEPQQCLVVEDALAGLQSGRAAGMTTVAIPDARWVDVTLFPGRADGILDELAQLPEWIARYE